MQGRRGDGRSLRSALAAATAGKDLNAEQALVTAECVQEQADAARAEKLRTKSETGHRAVDGRFVECGSLPFLGMPNAPAARCDYVRSGMSSS
ncbi:hypothetical protein [Amycolatopsis sp. SID8362]|uniref:hypothetical protein n=1 Tax=Amycolatopsis sp. SID8362 TaxID=2690346 RepID=UPI001EF2F446|nr:hypothetical protein [Amycolatopsis sp. SID8362]